MLAPGLAEPADRSQRQSGQPDVTFGFSSNGARLFQSVTAAIARRGDLVSGFNQAAPL